MSVSGRPVKKRSVHGSQRSEWEPSRRFAVPSRQSSVVSPQPPAPSRQSPVASRQPATTIVLFGTPFPERCHMRYAEAGVVLSAALIAGCAAQQPPAAAAPKLDQAAATAVVTAQVNQI